MFNKQKDDETSVWISNTDLMSGLLVLFLFISIIMTQNLSAANQRFKNVTQKSIQFKQELKNNIDKNFSSQEIHQYHLGQADGSASFDQAGCRFAAGSSELTPEFKETLRHFLPKYLKAINTVYQKNHNSIKEIRIEGHTSSEWTYTNATDAALSDDEKYIKNMELSQSRTREIINYALSLPELKPYHGLIKDKLTANGLSSSKLKKINGVEDKNASRRIAFRVIANDEATVKKLNMEINNDY